MPVLWLEDLDGRWPVVICANPYSLTEFEAVMRDLLSQSVTRAPLRLLIDCRYGNALMQEIVRGVVAVLSDHPDLLAKARIALVGEDMTAPDTVRTSEVTRDTRGLPMTLRMFEAWEKAEEWLGEDSRP